MTHKDFRILATALLAARPDNQSDPEMRRWIICVGEVADALALNYPAFDLQKFVAASYGHVKP